MTYRALFVADVHAGNSLPWSLKDPETLITDRLLDILRVLDTMAIRAQRNKIKDIWILGDLIDKRLVDAVTLKLVTSTLVGIQERGLRVLLVPGNHEASDAACRHFTLDQYASMNFWVAGQQDGEQVGIVEPVPGFRIAAIPFLPVARFTEILDNTMAANKFDLLLIHQTIQGGAVGNWVCPDGVSPAVLESFAKNTLSGHFHSPQDITKNVSYLGAPVQHSFGDRDDARGFWDIEFTGTEVKRIKVKVASPTFHELEWITSERPPDMSAIPQGSYINVKVIGPKTAVDKLWTTAEHWASEEKQQLEARLLKLTPVTDNEPTRRRASLQTSDERPTWDTVVSRYLSGTDCTGLNRDRLEQLGKELITDADR